MLWLSFFSFRNVTIFILVIKWIMLTDDMSNENLSYHWHMSSLIHMAYIHLHRIKILTLRFRISCDLAWLETLKLLNIKYYLAILTFSCPSLYWWANEQKTWIVIGVTQHDHNINQKYNNCKWLSLYPNVTKKESD